MFSLEWLRRCAESEQSNRATPRKYLLSAAAPCFERVFVDLIHRHSWPPLSTSPDEAFPSRRSRAYTDTARCEGLRSNAPSIRGRGVAWLSVVFKSQHFLRELHGLQVLATSYPRCAVVASQSLWLRQGGGGFRERRAHRHRCQQGRIH